MKKNRSIIPELLGLALLFLFCLFSSQNASARSCPVNVTDAVLTDDTNTDINSTCFDCHGNPSEGKPPRPIWGNYPQLSHKKTN
jgi:cytochrome c553